ncbi:MAG: nitrate reductase molybdenum cofactor assembly chaperone [Alphaproteobacteria bacterium]|nr:nitrate reductase molybdenum cofactor assembly chaperone [Alphaproteobacteria bacterium]
MTGTLKVLSILLSYPTEQIVAAAPDLKQMIERDGLVPAKHRRGLYGLIDEFAKRDLFDLQERYVLLFDRTRSLSLHIFEHIHGESRDRGQAMVDLMQLYEQNGLHIEAKELPDYLPLFLEFLSTLPTAEALALLAEPLHILTALRERHRKRKSAYTPVFGALVALTTAKPNAQDVADLLAEPEDDPNDLKALDRIWDEEAVTFGPGGPGGPGAPDESCPSVRDMLARMDRPRNSSAS